MSKPAATIHLKRAYDSPDVADGRRVLVDGGNAGKGFQSVSSGRIDRKTPWPG
jgi:hypothetical protein